MPNVYGLLNVGQTALLAQQKAIDITGNNIANVNTPGYSRQQLTLVQKTPVRVEGMTMSTGVTSETRIQRFYDQFLVAQLNSEKDALGRWDAQKNVMAKTEILFDEVSGYGLNGAMSDFWNAWQNVANNPSGHVERVSLVNTTQYLTSTFSQLRGSLTSLQEDIDDSVDSAVTQINIITSQIADLNLKIIQVESGGHNANDFRDQRDSLANDLSTLIDIESFEDGDGNLTITAGSGQPLVEIGNDWTLSTANSGGVQHVYWNSSNGSTTDITTTISGGELKGFIYGRDTLINGYLTDLDSLASTLITQVNTLHSTSAGYGLDGTQNNFFTGSDASDIAVNTAIVSNPNKIAAASDSAQLPGDNTNAIAIANLQSALTMSGGAATFDNYYTALVGEVGQDVLSSNFNYEHEVTMVNHLEQRRQEISGVSLDEEMVNMIQHQHAYNAAARLITMTDELLDTLLSLTR
ncbi:MAG: flagellar hook-associated protein FlgK [Desulfobacteraceae bacterium]|nr:flagellar hook-associated protein FlgK [Desulfobacteraceae bacterium]